jgi:flagellar biosynthetic protein FlhB
MRLGFGLFKVLIVAIVAGSVLWLRWEQVLRSSALDIGPLSKFLIDICLATLLWVGLALMLLAAIDFALQRWKYEQDLRMTHQFAYHS